MAAAVSYAPPDPTLPKPWKGLIDGNTGSLYFWNTETNATQYDRPAVAPPSPAPQRSAAADLSNGSQIHQIEGGRENGSYAMNGVAKVAQELYAVQDPYVGPHPLNGMANVEHESSGAPVSRESREAYQLQHEITVTGVNVPLPFTTFESTGFPSEILREMRYSLRGANVVHCAGRGYPWWGGLHIVGVPFTLDPL